MKIEVEVGIREVFGVECSDGWLWGRVGEFPLQGFRQQALRDLRDVSKFGPLGKKVLSDPNDAKSRNEFLRQAYEMAAIPSPSAFDFVRLPNEEQKAAEYIEEHGVFRETNLKRPRRLPSQIERFWKKTTRGNERPFTLQLSDVWREQRNIRKLSNLNQALLDGDLELAWQAARQLDANVNDLHPASAFHRQMARGLAGAGLDIGFRDQRGDEPFGVLPFAEPIVSVPLIRVKDVLGGLYADLWNLYVSESPLRTCQRCGNPFLGVRQSKRYCGRPCEQADKQHRYRDKRRSTSRTE